MKKTLIFVDGQNLFYALRDMGIYEREINWSAFLRNLLMDDDELVRTYWYQAQKLSQPRFLIDRARRIVSQENPALEGDLEEQAENIIKRAHGWYDDRVKKYERQLHRYDELAIEYSEIEMVRRGIIKVDPFKELYLGEKGIDVALAVHMIKFHGKCDKIILLSGDLDYAEAVQFIKDNLKTVHVVRLFKGQPPVNRNISRTLMALADKVIDVYESEIREKFLKIS